MLIVIYGFGRKSKIPRRYIFLVFRCKIFPLFCICLFCSFYITTKNEFLHVVMTDSQHLCPNLALCYLVSVFGLPVIRNTGSNIKLRGTHFIEQLNRQKLHGPQWWSKFVSERLNALLISYTEPQGHYFLPFNC